MPVPSIVEISFKNLATALHATTGVSWEFASANELVNHLQAVSGSMSQLTGRMGTVHRTNWQALADVFSEALQRPQAYMPGKTPWSVASLTALLTGKNLKALAAVPEELATDLFRAGAHLGKPLVTKSGQAAAVLKAVPRLDVQGEPVLPGGAGVAHPASPAAEPKPSRLTAEAPIDMSDTMEQPRVSPKGRLLRNRPRVPGTPTEVPATQPGWFGRKLATLQSGGLSRWLTGGAATEETLAAAKQAPTWLSRRPGTGGFAGLLPKQSGKLATYGRGAGRLATSPLGIVAMLAFPWLAGRIRNITAGDPAIHQAVAQSDPMRLYLQRRLQALQERKLVETLASNPQLKTQYLQRLLTEQSQQQAANQGVPGRVSFGS